MSSDQIVIAFVSYIFSGCVKIAGDLGQPAKDRPAYLRDSSFSLTLVVLTWPFGLTFFFALSVWGVSALIVSGLDWLLGLVFESVGWRVFIILGLAMPILLQADRKRRSF